MTRIEAMTLLLRQLRLSDPEGYREFMTDLANELGYSDLVDAIEHGLEERDFPVTPLH